MFEAVQRNVIGVLAALAVLELQCLATLKHVIDLFFSEGYSRIGLPQIFTDYISIGPASELLCRFIPLGDFKLVVDANQHDRHRVDDAGDIGFTLAQLLGSFLQHLGALRNPFFKRGLDLGQCPVGAPRPQVGANQKPHDNQQDDDQQAGTGVGNVLPVGAPVLIAKYREYISVCADTDTQQCK